MRRSPRRGTRHNHLRERGHLASTVLERASGNTANTAHLRAALIACSPVCVCSWGGQEKRTRQRTRLAAGGTTGSLGKASQHTACTFQSVGNARCPLLEDIMYTHTHTHTFTRLETEQTCFPTTGTGVAPGDAKDSIQLPEPDNSLCSKPSGGCPRPHLCCCWDPTETAIGSGGALPRHTPPALDCPCRTWPL